MAKGYNVMKHKSITQINEMLNDGYSPKEVSQWIRNKYKHRSYWLSEVTLQAYRNNYLKLDRAEIAKRRQMLMDAGKTKDVNAIDTFTAVKEFTEAKNAMTTELVDALGNFRSIQDKILERINLVEEKTKDDDGNPVYKQGTEIVLQGYLTRLESMTNSFAKVYQEMKKAEGAGGSTEISITMSEMNKYSEIYKGVMQKILAKLDPGLINEFFQIYAEEMAKASGEGGESKVNISINNNTSPNINIVTGEEAQQNQEPDDTEGPDAIDIEAEDVNPEEPPTE